MKKLFSFLFWLTAMHAMAQAPQSFEIKIVSLEGDVQKSIPFATVTIDKNKRFVANEWGIVKLAKTAAQKISISISAVGFETLTKEMDAENKTIELQRLPLMLEPVELKASRAGEKSPFAKTNLNKAAIEKNNLGQDLPFLLNQTPSLVVNSDAGNGIGYTGLRIRGTDATRINVTINGIPYNDPESQGVYFVDLPDIASSLNSIQIQRGVGTSTNGAGAFGASINLSTNEVNTNAYAEAANSYGSFNSWKHTLKGGTGLINNHWTADARFSKIVSDGFVDRAASDLQSFYLSGAYISKKTMLRLNIMSCKEKTYQSWNGVPEAKLRNNQAALLTHYNNNIGTLYFNTNDSLHLFNDNNRSFNVYNYENQTDNYTQDHYQAFVNHQFDNGMKLNLALYSTVGEGNYEQYKYKAKFSSYGLPNYVVGTTTIKKTDLIRQLWLKNVLNGVNLSLTQKKGNENWTAGVGFNQFDGNHFGKIIWAAVGVAKDYEWYRYKSKKTDMNIFAKWEHAFNAHWTGLIDVQYRKVDYQFAGTRKFPTLSVNEQFNFFNPKLGVTYSNKNLTAYASFAVGQKEPNRSDYENAGANIATPNSEKLTDVELGVEERKMNYSWHANFYYMQYKDQLVLTGKINDVGDAVRINVPNSYRMGLELEGTYLLNEQFSVAANASFSQNKLSDFYDATPRYDASFTLVKQDTNFYSSSTLAYSPNMVAGFSLQYNPVADASIALSGKLVSDQFLDNTASNNKLLKGYFTNDLRLAYSWKNKLWKEINFSLQINNLWNLQYESNGYTYSYFYDNNLVKENFYFPMAGTNWLFGMQVKL
jgi:iron complex outermembrane recepter protein